MPIPPRITPRGPNPPFNPLYNLSLPKHPPRPPLQYPDPMSHPDQLVSHGRRDAVLKERFGGDGIGGVVGLVDGGTRDGGGDAEARGVKGRLRGHVLVEDVEEDLDVALGLGEGRGLVVGWERGEREIRGRTCMNP